MNLRMGSQSFFNVQIPLLWGSRAILQDKKEQISIIDLGGEEARLEVLAGKPAPGVDFKPTHEGVTIIIDDVEVYTFDADRALLQSESLNLPPVRIGSSETIVGTNRFSGNVVQGFGVGIKVSERGIAMGAPLPEGLAKLVV